MCTNLQPPNTPVSIKTGPTLLAVVKAEAGPNADGCIAPGSVWIPSGLRVTCLRTLGCSCPSKLRGRGLYEPCMLADQDGCGVHMAWDPGPRILTLIFRTPVLVQPNSYPHIARNYPPVSTLASWAAVTAHICTGNELPRTH